MINRLLTCLAICLLLPAGIYAQAADPLAPRSWPVDSKADRDLKSRLAAAEKAAAKIQEALEVAKRDRAALDATASQTAELKAAVEKSRWTVLQAVLTGLPAIIAAIAGVIAALAAYRGKQVAQGVPQKLDQIHVLVNGNLSRAQADVATLTEELARIKSAVAALPEDVRKAVEESLGEMLEPDDKKADPPSTV